MGRVYKTNKKEPVQAAFQLFKKCLWRSLVSPFQRKLLFLVLGFFFKAVVNPTPGGLARSSGCCYPWMCIFSFLYYYRGCKIPPWIVQGTVPMFWLQRLRKHLMYFGNAGRWPASFCTFFFSWGPIFMRWSFIVDSKEILFLTWTPLFFFFFVGLVW